LRFRLSISIAVAVSAAGVLLAAVSADAQRRDAGSACPHDPVPFHRCAIERAASFNPPRTADGHPDFQGIWHGQTSGVENIEEHPDTGDVGAGPTLIVDPADGKIPYQPWAIAARAEHVKTYIDPNVPCFLSGVPRTLYTPGDIQIVESTGDVAIIHSRGHMYRIIPTDRPSLPAPGVRLWQGLSKGQWEGNTLVVDVTNQNGKTWLDQAGNFHSEAVHIVERYTMVDVNTIHYEARIEDPKVYTRPWTMAFALTRVTQPDYEVWEEACHEGEKNTQILLGLGYKLYPGPQ
jgi:hypothetical protein